MEQLQQLKEIWARLSARQKIVVVIVPTMMMIVLAIFVAMNSRPQMVVLYSNLTGDDAGLILQKLKDEKIPYEITDGETVKVPRDAVYETRLKMASLGLPQGGAVGFEIFDKTKMAKGG